MTRLEAIEKQLHLEELIARVDPLTTTEGWQQFLNELLNLAYEI